MARFESGTMCHSVMPEVCSELQSGVPVAVRVIMPRPIGGRTRRGAGRVRYPARLSRCKMSLVKKLGRFHVGSITGAPKGRPAMSWGNRLERKRYARLVDIPYGDIHWMDQ